MSSSSDPQGSCRPPADARGPDHLPIPDSESYVDQLRMRYLQKRRQKIWLKAAAASAFVILVGVAAGTEVFPITFLCLWILAVVWNRTIRGLIRLKKLTGMTVGFNSEEANTGAEPARPVTDQERAIHNALRESAATLDRCYRGWQWSLGGSFGLAGAGILLLHPWLDDYSFWCAPIVVCAGAFAMRWFRVHGDRAALETVRQIENAGPEVAGAVIDFILASESHLHGPALRALSRVLRRFRPTDGAYLKPAHRRFLYSFLNPGQISHQPDMAVAVLYLIEQLSDPDAEPYLQEIIATLNPNQENERPLVNGAYLALQSIGRADATIGKRGTLLSPGFAPDDLSGSLLRPAGGANKEGAEALLRSVDSAGDGEGV